MMDVVNVAAGGKVHDSLSSGGVTATSSTEINTQAKNHSTTLKVTLRNMVADADVVQVKWYFFAKPFHGQEGLLETNVKDVTIPGGGVESFEITSTPVQTVTTTRTTTTTSNSAGNTSASVASSEAYSGTRLTGWAVALLVDGKIVNVRGSEFRYEDMVKDPAKLNAHPSL